MYYNETYRKARWIQLITEYCNLTLCYKLVIQRL